MSRYTDGILARFRSAESEGSEDREATETAREPVGGLDPYGARRKTPGQLAQQARRGRYTIGL